MHLRATCTILFVGVVLLSSTTSWKFTCRTNLFRKKKSSCTAGLVVKQTLSYDSRTLWAWSINWFSKRGKATTICFPQQWHKPRDLWNELWVDFAVSEVFHTVLSISENCHFWLWRSLKNTTTPLLLFWKLDRPPGYCCYFWSGQGPLWRGLAKGKFVCLLLPGKGGYQLAVSQSMMTM